MSINDLACRYNVLDFGADPTGQNSSDVAFTACVNAARNCRLTSAYSPIMKNGTVYIPRGIYSGLTSYNLTNCEGLTIEGEGQWGSILYFDGQTGDGKVAFDCAGSSYITIKDVNIQAINLSTGNPPDVIPTTAILFADNTTIPKFSNKNTLFNVNIFGWWSTATLSLYRTTNNYFYGCQFLQEITSSPTLFIGSINSIGITSTYSTLEASGFICSENDFYSCEFHNSKHGNPSVACIYFDSAVTPRFTGGIIDGGGTGHSQIIMYGSCQYPSFNGVKFYTESPYIPAYMFNVVGTCDRLMAVGLINNNRGSTAVSTGTAMTNSTINNGITP